MGLIVNEAVSNALKHAFPANRSGTVVIDAELRGNTCYVTVRDDGVGFPAGAGPGGAGGMGMQIIEVLARQLGATVEITGTGGTTCSLRFSAVGLLLPRESV